MSVVQTNWNPLNESPGAAEAARRADEAFEIRWDTADFEAWARDISEALWGIWELSLTSSAEIAEDVRDREEEDRQWDNPELLLAQLDDNIESVERLNNNLQELIEAPYIQRLIDDSVISTEIWNTILLWIKNGNEFWEVINSLSEDEVTYEQKEAIINWWSMMNNEEDVEQFINDFENDFWAEFNDRIDWVFEVELKQNAFDLVAQGYMIGESDNPEEKQQALNMSFWTAINVATNWRQFNRTEYFNVRQREVRNPDLTPDRRLQSLTEILAIVNTDQWWKSKTIRETNQRTRLQETIAQAWLTEQYLSAQAELRQAQLERDQDQILRLQERLSQIVEETEQITWTELWDFSIELEWASETHEDTSLS